VLCYNEAVRRRFLLLQILLYASLGATVVSCAQRWCQTWDSKLLCDDFDEGSSVSQEGVPFLSTVGNGGSFALSGNSYTPPNSVLGTTNPSNDDAGGGVLLSGGLTPQPAPPQLTCQVQLQPLALSATPGDSASVFMLSFTDSGGLSTGTLSLVTDVAGNASFTETYPNADGGSLVLSHPLGVTLTNGDWSLFVLTRNTGGASTSFTASLGGSAASGTLEVPLPPVVTIALSMGPVDPGGPSTGWSFLYDDLVCR
jgi:hypothetical protein